MGSYCNVMHIFRTMAEYNFSLTHNVVLEADAAAPLLQNAVSWQ